MATLNLEIGLMLGLFTLAVVLFSSERFRVDVSAVILLSLLGLSSLIPGVELISKKEIFTGFSSHAVVALMAVMIIGAGIHRTGFTNGIINWIMRTSHGGEQRTMLLTAGAAGLLASTLQNIGSAALFTPLVSRLSQRAHLSRARLMMPMAFAAIVGGAITMIGSSPLILLNDLLPSNVEHIALFEVAPIGLSLLAGTLIFFALFGMKLLPNKDEQSTLSQTSAFFQDFYSLDADIYELHIPNESPLMGRKLAIIERAFRVRFVGAQFGGEARIAPAKDMTMEPNSVIAVMGTKRHVLKLVQASDAHFKGGLEIFAEALIQTRAGVSEFIIPPTSSYVDKTIGELGLRKTQGLAVLAVRRDNETHYKNMRELVLRPGDLIIGHSSWKNLSHLTQSRDLALLSSDSPQEEVRPFKVIPALASLALAILLVLNTDLVLSVALMAGAVGMVVTGVLSMDEAYDAISWKTIFLLAGLIPLGLAAEHSGTAQWLGNNFVTIMGDSSTYAVLLALAVITSIFSLLISNVGATVLLVPVAISAADNIGSDPRLFALAIALSATNAFILPTHPVNVLTMGAAGYTSKDYLRVGAPMTLLYLVISLGVLIALF